MVLPLMMLFFSQGILIYSILVIFINKKTAISRIQKYIQSNEKKKKKEALNKDGFRQLSKAIGKKLSGIIFLKGYQRYLKTELERANILLKVEEVITISLLLSMFGLVYYGFSQNLMMSAVLSVFLWLLPLLIISSKKKKRIKEINNQLGDLLVLISNSLKAGYSFLQSVEAAAKEMPPPISDEFVKMLREMNLGVSTEKALDNLTNRVQSRDLEMIVTAILIQRQIGGNLAEVLDNISYTIRERIKIKGEIKAMTAQGRMSGVIISLLPVFLTVVFFLLNPQYIMRLFTNPIGIGMLLFGIIMQIIGMIMIKKITSIEV